MSINLFYFLFVEISPLFRAVHGLHGLKVMSTLDFVAKYIFIVSVLINLPAHVLLLRFKVLLRPFNINVSYILKEANVPVKGQATGFL